MSPMRPWNLANMMRSEVRQDSSLNRSHHPSLANLTRGAHMQEHGNRPLRVFLCHASEDKERVRKLYKLLQAAQVKPWLDEEDILPGQEWADVIPQAVRDSDAVIVCVSQFVNKTGYLQKEIHVALDVAEEQPPGAIYVIPVRLEECEMHQRLQKWQWVDLFQSQGFERLMRSLQSRAQALDRIIPTIPPTIKERSGDMVDLGTVIDRAVEQAIAELGPIRVDFDSLVTRLASEGIDKRAVKRSVDFLREHGVLEGQPNIQGSYSRISLNQQAATEYMLSKAPNRDEAERSVGAWLSSHHNRNAFVRASSIGKHVDVPTETVTHLVKAWAAQDLLQFTEIGNGDILVHKVTETFRRMYS
jgi:TIR domain